ncbi:FAST kinase domain-containing protein 3, mitochondrial [Orycteropus afer afer]|uniref:FAST kinase domain-containing protein 3, mitochondrial n=1 Tax=Orycteropus afer afer TaxID=1230840 RepID=A0AC54ZB39_ORYAF|nr:FAST kinase domain-containing protein 3, mitochondrial [Orycteropus afer afer]
MALVTLCRNLCHLCDFRLHGALSALKSRSASHTHKAVREHLRWSILAPPPTTSCIQSHHTCCEHFCSENSTEPQPIGQPESPQMQDWDGFEQNTEHMDKMFHRKLNSFTSSEEVLSFVGTLETLSDTRAAGALQRIWEVEKKDDTGRLPRGVLEDRVFKSLCFQFIRQSPGLTNTGLVTALQALTLLHVDPQSSLFENLVAECHNRLQKGVLEVHDLCVLGQSLIKLQGPSRMLLELIIGQLQGEELDRFSPEDIVALYRIFQACPEKVDQHQPFLNKINSFSLSIVPSLSPKAISQVLSVLVALDQTHALPLVIKLGKYVVRHIPRFTGEELGSVLEAFIYFGYNDRFFTKALEHHIDTLSLTPNPEVVSRITQYCSRKRILSEPILNAAAESFVCQSEKFSPSQISDLIEPFGKLNYLPPNAPAFFRKLENMIFTHFHDFPPKKLLRILHSCSLIERHPVNFMAKIFSPYFLQQLQGTESYLDRLSLAQLTQLFLTSILECPFYKGPRLLPKYQVKSFLTPCCSLETPMDFQLYKSVMTGLIDLLGARQYFASKVFTPYCYTIDVEIKLDAEGFVLPCTADEDIHKRVALCVDGPRRFCFNSSNLLGKEAIKQRHLRLLGYEVVQVSFHLFLFSLKGTKCSANPADQASYT